VSSPAVEREHRCVQLVIRCTALSIISPAVGNVGERKLPVLYSIDPIRAHLFGLRHAFQDEAGARPLAFSPDFDRPRELKDPSWPSIEVRFLLASLSALVESYTELPRYIGASYA
jgi:hypothetical protein